DRGESGSHIQMNLRLAARSAHVSSASLAAKAPCQGPYYAVLSALPKTVTQLAPEATLILAVWCHFAT
ncbi:MAG: hypothetical protein ACK2UO_13460, partial [Caldilineaceae bacterium]